MANKSESAKILFVPRRPGSEQIMSREELLEFRVFSMAVRSSGSGCSIQPFWADGADKTKGPYFSGK
jgi:hypothetical protein